MKKIVFFSAITFVATAFVACTPKASKSVAGSKPADAAPTKSEVLSHFTQEKIDEGKVIFTGNCGKCHKLPPTEKFNNVQWTKIMKRMAPKAKLNEQDAELVRAFVIANSKEG